MICLILFAVIAGFLVFNRQFPFDSAIQDFLFSSRTDILTALFRSITYTANWQFIAALCGLLLLWPKTTVTFGLPLATAAILSSLAYKLLKTLFQRPRPDIALHLIEQGGYSFPSGHSMTGLLFYGLLILLLCRQLLSAGGGALPGRNGLFSEASGILPGKVRISAIKAETLAKKNGIPSKIYGISAEKRKTAAFLLTVLLVLLIFLIGVSRIYLGVHYPSDVLGGWSFGAFILILFSFFVSGPVSGSKG